MKRRSYVLTSILAGALALAGCEGDTSTSASTGAGASASTSTSTSTTSSGIDTAADTTTATAVETGTVKLSVAFPESNAEKALISSDVQWVGFVYCRVPEMESWCYYQDGMPGNGMVAVSRADPSATVMLAPGKYQFEAATFADENMNTMIDYAASGGEIVEGNNTVKLTFLQGDWSFKTAAGADDTITLGNGTVFDGFKLYAYGDSQGTPAAARKSAFNKALPAGFAEYGVVLKTSSGNKDGGWVGVVSQFHSGNNNNASMRGIDYNLSRDCFMDYDSCGEGVGDWFLFMMRDPDMKADYEGDALWELLPGEETTDADGNPLDVSGNSGPTDGVTIVADFVEGQIVSRSITLVDTAAGAAKAVAADMPLSRDAGLKSALAADADSASKSATTTNIGTVNNVWYDPVIMASGDGSNRGTWNFDRYGYNEFDEWVVVEPDGCLVTDNPSGVYAECGWLETTWELDPDTDDYVVTADLGEFSWGFAPTDPNDLGEYDCVGYLPEGYYEPWCFWDQNGDGTVDMGSFKFTHYMRADETIENVRMHRVTAKGVELPGTEVILQ